MSQRNYPYPQSKSLLCRKHVISDDDECKLCNATQYTLQGLDYTKDEPEEEIYANMGQNSIKFKEKHTSPHTQKLHFQLMGLGVHITIYAIYIEQLGVHIVNF